MRFFTPDLYDRFNSADPVESDQADAEWERAVAAYQKHLENMRMGMPPDVARLAGICLHDAQIVDWSEASLSTRDASNGKAAIVTVRLSDSTWRLIYAGTGRIHEKAANLKWRFSSAILLWLYDEIHPRRDQKGGYEHRVLLSDGRVLALPFQSVAVLTTTDQRTSVRTSA